VQDVNRQHSNGRLRTAWLLALAGWTLAALLIGRERGIIPAARPPAGPEAPPPAAPPAAGWAPAFARWEADSGAGDALAAFCLVDPDGRVAFASPLAERPLCPASALKTLTAAAGLRILGPDHRFETRVEATAASATDGTLPGDLVLVGGGDPTLSLADLDRLAETVAGAGLRVVAGVLRADLAAFPAVGVNDHWNWGDLGNAYGAGAYALNVAANRLTVVFVPGREPGAATTVEAIAPPWPELVVANDVRTAGAGSGDRVTAYATPGGRALRLTGTVPAGVRRFGVGAAMPDPSGFAVYYFRQALEAKGVSFRSREIPPGPQPVTLATHRSAPLAEVTGFFNRTSDNLAAQCVFLALGRQLQADPAAALVGHWREAGVEFRGLRLIDGSGLARANMIRPVDLARVNHLAAAGPHGETFLESLPTAAGGRLRYKPGYMSGVRTEVGFLLDAAGRRWTYCLMLNGLDPATDARAMRSLWIDKMLERLGPR
jgi:serine-type D-Ala-D-Ala carboxypeptidase/endopeptidase (penicillin-binding protein 4)